MRWARHNKSLATALAVIAVLLIAGTLSSGIVAVYFHRLAAEANEARQKADLAADRERRSATDRTWRRPPAPCS